MEKIIHTQLLYKNIICIWPMVVVGISFDPDFQSEFLE